MSQRKKSPTEPLLISEAVEMGDLYRESYIERFEELHPSTIASKFNARNISNVSYELLPADEKRYYELETGGEQHLNINDIGLYDSKTVSKINDSKATVVCGEPADNPGARLGRFKSFEDEYKRKIGKGTDQGYDDFDNDIVDGEEILATLDCTEIENMPSTTLADDRSIVRGRIKVSVIHHKENGYRVLFSVTSNSKHIRIREHFKEEERETSLLCCCVKIGLDNYRNGYQRNHSSMAHIEYQSKHRFNSQFFSLPVSSCLVDVQNYRSSNNEFSVDTDNVSSSSGTAGLCANCCISIKCNCCSLFYDCSVPHICEFVATTLGKSARYAADEEYTYDLDDIKYNHRLSGKCEEASKITFTSNGVSEDLNYVKIAYQSLLDNKIRICKLKIRKTSDENKTFNSIKKFVSTLEPHRRRDEMRKKGVAGPMDSSKARQLLKNAVVASVATAASVSVIYYIDKAVKTYNQVKKFVPTASPTPIPRARY